MRAAWALNDARQIIQGLAMLQTKILCIIPPALIQELSHLALQGDAEQCLFAHEILRLVLVNSHPSLKDADIRTILSVAWHQASCSLRLFAKAFWCRHHSIYYCNAILYDILPRYRAPLWLHLEWAIVELCFACSRQLECEIDIKAYTEDMLFPVFDENFQALMLVWCFARLQCNILLMSRQEMPNSDLITAGLVSKDTRRLCGYQQESSYFAPARISRILPRIRPDSRWTHPQSSGREASWWSSFAWFTETSNHSTCWVYTTLAWQQEPHNTTDCSPQVSLTSRVMNPSWHKKFPFSRSKFTILVTTTNLVACQDLSCHSKTCPSQHCFSTHLYPFRLWACLLDSEIS